MIRPPYSFRGENNMSKTYSRVSAPSAGVFEATAAIISAYVAQNVISPSAVPDLIAAVHGALAGIQAGMVTKAAEAAEPATSIRKSVTRYHLICLEDGKRVISLKRHLRMVHGMTADQYRIKWGLPRDYPTVAAEYSARRSVQAKEQHLGQKGRSAQSKRRALT